jgi:hypothetical protein
MQPALIAWLSLFVMYYLLYARENSFRKLARRLRMLKQSGGGEVIEDLAPGFAMVARTAAGTR